jgi:hypothetical protein
MVIYRVHYTVGSFYLFKDIAVGFIYAHFCSLFIKKHEDSIENGYNKFRNKIYSIFSWS